MAKLFAHHSKPSLDLPVNYNLLKPHMKRVVREQYALEQEGRCWHCEALLGQDPPSHVSSLTIHEELFPKGFFDHPIHLHHDHNTGDTIGAVHDWCNAVLWQFKGE